MTTPLSKIVAGDDIDSRVTGRKSGIKELAASIAAHGLLQPLVVRPFGEDGQFQVIDGNRRLLALQSLVKARTLKKDAAVDTLVISKDDAAAREASLAANIVRLELDPVDMYEQFAALAETESAAEIATRFGVTEKLVRQRLALGKLAPEIREALRKGKIKLEHAQAFTINEDHAAQLAAFKSIRFGDYTRADEIKRALSKETIDASTGMVKFVGLDAYVAAGGEVVESLFDKDSYVKDSGLVRRLAREKVEREAERLRAEGWSFVEIDADIQDWQDWMFDEVAFVDHMTPEERAAYEKEPNGWTKKAKEIEATVRQRMIADPAVRASSGCLVGYDDRHGNLEIQYGLVKPSKTSADESGSDEEDGDDEAEAGERDEREPEVEQVEVEEAAPRVTKCERERLSRTLSEAVRRAFPNSLSVAICAAIATLELGGASPLSISRQFGGDVDDEIDDKEWRDIFNEALGLTNAAQQRRLAKALGATVRLALPGLHFAGYADHDDIAALVAALDPHVFRNAMAEAFNARDYFQRGTTKMALEALGDMGVRPPANRSKANRSKANLVEAAIEAAAAHGYLPPELRTIHYDGPGAAAEVRQAAE